MGSEAANAILRTVAEPMTVKEIHQFAEVPLSTAYREVNRLAEANLLEERLQLDPIEGRHVNRYVRTFDTIEIRMTDEGIVVQLLS
ncbi:helix-turn-helix domain-containing protein [Halopelagius longus]|uniref:ArsR family transcriptional regulator n=1 Tax=Halopelagius longus TaxID=1236180 RepID=A0A370ILY5_9EURY|nr:ArsR family transcriptional regulator [Halopelagius longus]